MEGCKFLQPSYKSYTEKSYKESGEPKWIHRFYYC